MDEVWGCYEGELGERKAWSVASHWPQGVVGAGLSPTFSLVKRGLLPHTDLASGRTISLLALPASPTH